MFNDVNNKQNRPSVDDIFAETDKAAAPAPAPGSGAAPEISAQKVGLTADEAALPVEETPAAARNDKWFKIIIIIIVVLILALGGYLVYSKFIQPSPSTTPAAPSGGSDANGDAADNSADNNPTPTSTDSVANNPVGNAPATTTDLSATGAATSTASTTPLSLTDADSDGLTDAEEALLGTNPLLADTDNDALGDYEEVNIYKTNPLNPDTDGDTYLDGAEVKAGFDPNGPGKLPGIATSSQPKK
jgi:hypothetical protein